MNFIEVKNENYAKVLVNVDRITTIEAKQNGGTYIEIAGYGLVNVLESYEDIKNMLGLGGAKE